MIDITNPFLKVCFPLVSIIAVILISKYRLNLSLKQDLNLYWPKSLSLLLWLTLGLMWMLGTDYFMNWRGEWNFVPWQNQPFSVSVLRILAVVIIGPTAEELVFRGLILFKLEKMKFTAEWLIVVIISAGWAAIHINYSIEVISVIFIFGLLLGFAKLKSNSLVTPILMHILWNLYAVW
jgi:membrane protease YdiL (CAAX protease family)